MKVRTLREAWEEVDKIFMTDYVLDEQNSKFAGYPIYKSTAFNHPCDFIYVLNNRLEVILGSKSINIWIVSEEHGKDIEVTLIAKTGETRIYKTYDSFKNDFRFFWSTGAPYKDFEDHFEKIIQSLRNIDNDGVKIETQRSGLNIIFTYKKWNTK